MTSIANSLHAHHLVDLSQILPNAMIDIPYANSGNFTGKQIYPVNKAYLLKDAALALAKANEHLNHLGYRIKILDAYRPFHVQELFWDIFPNENYVAKPVRDPEGRPVQGSKHNRGAAVDITLVDLEGREIEMPSGFDEFSEKAHRHYRLAGPIAKRNALLLENTLQEHGFVGFPYEWWHFDYQAWDRYPLLDLPLSN